MGRQEEEASLSVPKGKASQAADTAKPGPHGPGPSPAASKDRSVGTTGVPEFSGNPEDRGASAVSS